MGKYDRDDSATRKRHVLFLLIACFILLAGCTNTYPQGVYLYGTEESVILKISTSNGTEFYEIPANGEELIDIRKGSVNSACVVKSMYEPEMIDNLYRVSVSYEQINITKNEISQIAIKSLIPSSISVEGIYIAESNGVMERYMEEGQHSRIAMTELPRTVEIYGAVHAFFLENEEGTPITNIGGYPINIKMIDNILVIF